MRKLFSFSWLAIGLTLAAQLGAQATSGGDDLDERIDEVSVGIRADRPWAEPGTAGPHEPCARGPANAVAAARFARHPNAWTFELTPFFWAPVIAGVSWNLNRCFSLVAGWAVLDIDYENGSFGYDVNLSGPYLGATFRF